MDHFLNAQDLSMMFFLCSLEVFEDPIHMFFTNLCLSLNNTELETLVLGTRIILNDFLFEKVFNTKFFGVIPFMNNTWLENFKAIFDDAKKAVSDPEQTAPPLVLCTSTSVIRF
ncbi:hypothetical protein FXO37_22094 [Capsicum annuum]|nr:hypothetical protein FXO37_22094 [Capsicum annuum]